MKKRLLSLCMFVAIALMGWAQTRDVTLTITVTTATGDNLEGQVVNLTQTDYSLSYGTLTLNASGECTVNVYAGNHELSVSRPGYQPASTTFVVEEGAGSASVSLQLVEKVRTPFALTAQAHHDAYTGQNSISMKWNTEPPAFFDDFEDYEPFAVQFGEWTGIDADMEAAAALLGSYPNRCVMQYAQIINPLVVEPTWWYDYPILRPFAGQQYVGFTRTSSGNANDDWLISPAITVGNEHALMFMAKAADKYAERFQVYVTTILDNPQPSDFVRLDEGNYESADMKGWHQFQYSLEAYSGQQVKFAIRYISHYNSWGSFMLMVDDVYVGQAKDYGQTVAKVKARRARRSEANPNEVFHIYLDGTEIGTTEDYEYTLSDVSAGTHMVGVKAAYRATESELVTTTVEIPSDGFAHVSFVVSADSKLSPDGQKITLINTSTTDSYEVTVADGKASVASLPVGTYVVNVEEGAFSAYQQTITVSGDMTVNIALTDRFITPYNITADTPADAEEGTYVVKWNQELVFNDSFEDYDDFATGAFGEWKSIDRDQMPVYPIGLGSNIVAFPGSGTATNPMPVAPIVFNPWTTEPPMLPTDPAVTAPTGDKTIVFFSPQRGKADKWLISPVVEIRDGYVLNTTLKSYDNMYLESVEFCVSTDGAAPSDFTVVATASNIPSTEWTQYETDLSAYAGQEVRLAVHYVSYDTFFLQLDDFIVGPQDGDVPFVDYGNVEHYDVYLDGEKLGESTTPTYTLTGLSSGSHTIGIVAVYKGGMSEMGTITILVTTGISTVTAEEMRGISRVFNLTGQQMEDELWQQPAGVYIIKQGNQYKKILKR